MHVIDRIVDEVNYSSQRACLVSRHTRCLGDGARFVRDRDGTFLPMLNSSGGPASRPFKGRNLDLCWGFSSFQEFGVEVRDPKSIVILHSRTSRWAYLEIDRFVASGPRGERFEVNRMDGDFEALSPSTTVADSSIRSCTYERDLLHASFGPSRGAVLRNMGTPSAELDDCSLPRIRHLVLRGHRSPPLSQQLF